MPVIPRKLARAYREAGSLQACARVLEINPKYLHDFMVKGKDPTNEEVRLKMFLPRRPRGQGKPRRKLLPGERQMQRRIAREARRTEKAINAYKENPHAA